MRQTLPSCLVVVLSVAAVGAQKGGDVAQQAAEANAPTVILQAAHTQWVESLTLIICTLVTAVVAPVVVMWARKKFTVKNGG